MIEPSPGQILEGVVTSLTLGFEDRRGVAEA